MEEKRPHRDCVEEIHKIIEGRMFLQTDKIELKLDNMMLKIDMKIQQAVSNGIDKYYGSERSRNKYMMDLVKFVAWFIGFVVAAYYIKG